MRNLRHRMIKKVAQGHTSVKKQTCEKYKEANNIGTMYIMIYIQSVSVD